MADSKKKVIIEVDMQDNASAGLKKLQSSTATTSEKFKAGFKKMAIAATTVAAAVTGTVIAITKMAERVGKIEGLAMGFERNFGDMENSLNSFRKASAGMVSDMDLMQTANRAALLGVTNDVDKLSQLMVTARLRGREMGLDMTTAFNDIVTGIGRGSPLILDNLGIKIPDALKKAMESMDETQKTQALLNFAIEDGANIAKEYGEVQLTTGERVAILQAKIVNLKDQALLALSEPLANIIDKLSSLIDKLEGTAKVIAEKTQDELVGMRDVLSNDQTGLGVSINRVGLAWGQLATTLGGPNKSAMELAIEMLTGWALIISKVADGISAIIFGIEKLARTIRNNWSIITKGLTTIERPAAGSGGKGFATGGVTTGGWTMVGERGAELVQLPRGSHVYNSEDTKQMSSGGGITINVNAPVTGVDNLRATILEAVNEATAKQNRLANYNLL